MISLPNPGHPTKIPTLNSDIIWNDQRWQFIGKQNIDKGVANQKTNTHTKKRVGGECYGYTL